MEKRNSRARENVLEHVQGSLISWKSIFAGLIVAVIAHLALSALGAGIGGASASSSLADGGNASGAAAGTGIWIGIAALLALFIGSYFATRTSPFITARVGAAQGLIIAAMFFAFLIYGAGMTVGAAGKGLGSMASAVGKGAGDISSSPAVQSTISKALGGANLKSDPSVVAQNLTSMMIRGDNDGAKNYLVYQTGMSRAEIDSKITTMKAEFDQKARDAGVAAAKGVSAAGWSLFIVLVLGAAASIFGGGLGSRANSKSPLADEHRTRAFVPSPAT